MQRGRPAKAAGIPTEGEQPPLFIYLPQTHPKPSQGGGGGLPSEGFCLPSEVTAENTSERGRQTNKQTDMKKKNSSRD